MGHNLEVVLVVTAPDARQPANSKFLLVEPPDEPLQLPSLAVFGESTLSCAAALLARLTGLAARVEGVGWLDLKLCPLADAPTRHKHGERWIAVPYGCLLWQAPPPLLPEARWLSFAEVMAARPLYLDHLDILVTAANYL